MREVEIAIIGAGSAGLYALPEVRKVTDNFVLINSGHFGTTCARVGCMPSKALIHAAELAWQSRHAGEIGLGAWPRADLAAVLRQVRSLRDGFTGKVADNLIKPLGDKVIRGHARFLAPNLLEVEGQRIQASKIILATGSTPVVPAAWQAFGERVLTTDSLFEQEDLPPSMAVLGLGVIGLEIGQALSRLGITMTGVDRLNEIGGLQDPQINRVAVELIGQEFPLWLGQPAELSQLPDGRLHVRCGEHDVVVDKVLAALGRKPNLAGLDLDKLGVPLDSRGLPEFNRQTMQIADLPVFIAGDVNGEAQVLHEAADEGRIAGFNASRREISGFRRKPRLGITFCDPQLAAVGAGWKELAENPEVVVGSQDFTFQGRSKLVGQNRGLLRLYGDRRDGRLLGAEMAVPRAENLAHLLALAIQQDMTVFDLLKMPFYHPVFEEGLQGALYNLGSQARGGPADGLMELEYA
jgi:dihydrolipoamide dehydrogenase